MIDHNVMARRIETGFQSLSRSNNHLIVSRNKYVLFHRHIRDWEVFQSCDAMWEDLSFFSPELYNLQALGFQLNPRFRDYDGVLSIMYIRPVKKTIVEHKGIFYPQIALYSDCIGDECKKCLYQQTRVDKTIFIMETPDKPADASAVTSPFTVNPSPIYQIVHQHREKMP